MMTKFIGRLLGVRPQPKRASAHPGPSERARLHALMIETTRQMRFELGLPWRI
jgi:hypothetical protein